jgi:hypothetical protein
LVVNSALEMDLQGYQGGRLGQGIQKTVAIRPQLIGGDVRLTWTSPLSQIDVRGPGFCDAV